LRFNNKGAKISALNTELAFTFNVCSKPSTIAIGYGRTWQVLGLSLPEQTFTGVIGVSLFRDTIEKIEFRHDCNYSANDTAGGGGSLPLPPAGSHRDSNTAMLQVDFYF